MEKRGRLMYHHNAASEKVPANILHLRESAAQTTAMRVLNAMTCSIGSPLPSNVDKWGGLKFSGTGEFQISTEMGWGSDSSSSPWWDPVFSCYCCCWIVSTEACKASFCSIRRAIWVLIVSASSWVAMATVFSYLDVRGETASIWLNGRISHKGVIQKRGRRLVLPLPTDDANCTFKKVRVMNTRVKYRFLGFRLIIGCLENALKGGIIASHGPDLDYLASK